MINISHNRILNRFITTVAAVLIAITGVIALGSDNPAEAHEINGPPESNYQCKPFPSPDDIGIWRDCYVDFRVIIPPDLFPPDSPIPDVVGVERGFTVEDGAICYTEECNQGAAVRPVEGTIYDMHYMEDGGYWHQDEFVFWVTVVSGEGGDGTENPFSCHPGVYNDMYIYYGGDGRGYFGREDTATLLDVVNLCDLLLEKPEAWFLEAEIEGAAATEGSLAIQVIDVNDLLFIINREFLRCTITNDDVDFSKNCNTLIDDGSLTTSSFNIRVDGLPASDEPYTMTLSYEEVCYTTRRCNLEDLISFPEVSFTFVIEAGQTTNVTIEVEGEQKYKLDDYPGEVPDNPPEPILPCNDGSFNNPLEFIMCPIVNFMFRAIDSVYSFLIIPQLNTNPLKGPGSGGEPEILIYNVWNSVRLIANVVFVGVFLLVIFGNTISESGIFTAYELRKTIPRLVFGVIGVQLSWYIVGFLIDIFNVLGAAMRGLVLAPINGFGEDLDFDLASSWDEIALLVGITGAALVAVWVGGIIMGLPMLLFPILMGLVITFIVVLARKVLILLLVVVSPLAFVVWVLPNTANLFKTWWGLLWKALFMYPLIILLISAGELFARLTAATNTTETGEQASALTTIFAMVALFAPYFMIPMTFRFAGSAVSEIANGLDKRGKGLNQRLFGTNADPRSWRGRRRKQQFVTRSRRKSRIMGAANRAANNDMRVLNKIPVVAGATRLTGRAVNKVGSMAKLGTADRNAQMLDEARKHVQTLTGSARDEEIYAILGDYQIISGSKLSAEAVGAARMNRRNPYMVQAALEYAIGKAGKQGELDQVYNRFMYGDDKDNHGKNPPHRSKFGGAMGRFEREKAFSLAADFTQNLMGDYKYRGRDGSMTTDVSRLKRFATEVNNRKSGYKDVTGQRAQYWEGIGEMSDQAQQIWQKAGGDTATTLDRSKLDTDEIALLHEMRRMREGFRDLTPTGGTPSANNARRDLQQRMAWLDHNNLKGI
jgi:ABC-type multidrug transport system fused ATPase/permease subunit